MPLKSATLPGLECQPAPLYRIDDYYPTPTPALIAAAERGELPRCVEVVAHRIRGRLDLEAVRARVEAATRGPWIYLFDSAVYSATEESLDRICEVPEGDDRPADMEFISNARTDIPALLDEIDRLTAEVGEWVSVDERVPEDAEDVIVVDRYGNRRTAYLREGTWYTTAGYRFIPTHWQPLPAPPE